jgi:glycine oxidase
MNEKRVLVVGGGAIGLAIGWRLARAGCAVVLFDRDRAGHSASWASAGMLTPLAEVQFEEEELLQLGLAGLEQFPEFVGELEAETGCSVGYRQDGVLLVGITQDDVAYLRFRHSYQQDLGLPVTWLSGAEARERESHLSAQVSAAVWCPGDHQVDNRRLVKALTKGFLQAGGELFEETEVDEILVADGCVKGVRVGDEVYEGNTVVLAAGSWSRLIPGLPNCAKPPVRPVRGQIMRLTMTEECTLNTMVWYSRVATSSVAYLVPKDGGVLVLGATSEEMGFEAEVTAGGLFELLRAAWDVVPGVYDLPVVESMAGLRPGSRDDAPILGKSPIEGLIMATGHYRKGILLTPLTALAIAEVILEDKTPEIIQPFGIERFGL